jgi:hypothetical protein
VLLDVGQGDRVRLSAVNEPTVPGEHSGLVNEKTVRRFRRNKSVQVGREDASPLANLEVVFARMKSYQFRVGAKVVVRTMVAISVRHV